MITSQLTGIHFPGDTPIAHWQNAGLPKPSLVRLREGCHGRNGFDPKATGAPLAIGSGCRAKALAERIAPASTADTEVAVTSNRLKTSARRCDPNFYNLTIIRGETECQTPQQIRSQLS